jgi:hypothetical protein
MLVSRLRLQIVVCFLCLTLAQFTAAQSQRKARVMVLGTFHFVRGQADAFRVAAGDMLTPKRQHEIAELVSLLKKYNPTKIAVEAPFGDDKLQERYQQYRAGNAKLSADEIDQIGFRLAKELGHERIYGIDSKSDMDFDRVSAFAQAHGQTKVLNQIMAEGANFTKDIDTALAEGTILDVFRKINSPGELRRNHQAYLDMATIGQGNDYPGAEVVGQWYTRNLRIFANLNRIVQRPDDRILVIFGQGHAYLLEQYIAASSNLTLDQFNDLK